MHRTRFIGATFPAHTFGNRMNDEQVFKKHRRSREPLARCHSRLFFHKVFRPRKVTGDSIKTAISNGRIYLRSDQTLFCMGNK
jgi:hypothetical protein